MIRRFLPKGTDFNEVSDKEIAKIEHTLNTRRRASLNYRSPNQREFDITQPFSRLYFMPREGFFSCKQ
ncbi:hypothetical protein [Piscirickettsia salmonis]|uniref:hypothetical protein n=1 Tax=Piscirickettsia salmonis TaxID=1238 RepID=UPI0002D2D18B|nr:hypothetical protein [Piscirickettsia salmonis]